MKFTIEMLDALNKKYENLFDNAEDLKKFRDMMIEKFKIEPVSKAK